MVDSGFNTTEIREFKNLGFNESQIRQIRDMLIGIFYCKKESLSSLFLDIIKVDNDLRNELQNFSGSS